MTSFIAFFKALNEIIGGLRAAYDLIKKAQVEGWYNDGKEIAMQIKNAKTDDERRALARRLADHANRLP